MLWISRQVERKSNHLIHITDVKDRKIANIITTKMTLEILKLQANENAGPIARNTQKCSY